MPLRLETSTRHVTGVVLLLAANDLGVTDNAAGLLIQDSGSATGGSITLNPNATSVLDAGQGLAFHNGTGGSRRPPWRPEGACDILAQGAGVDARSSPLSIARKGS